MRFAAIDVGSNAVRLLFCQVFEHNRETIFKKAELIRIPIRLGEDTFLKGKVSRQKISKLVTAMKAFRHLIDVYEALDYKACATAAMREASNNREIVSRIKKEAGINLEIIDGKTEAGILYSNHADEYLDKKNSYFYIDIGGGSTEISISHKKKNIASRSFNIGTVRLLNNKVSDGEWEEFIMWIRKKVQGYQPLTAIGSGGNINKLAKMSGEKKGNPIPLRKLKKLEELLKDYTLEERIKILGLKPDRADVIVPASFVLVTALKTAGIEKMIVPEIGLSDGIVHLLYEKYRKRKR